MIDLAYFDWYGTEQELKELDDILEKESVKIDGLIQVSFNAAHG